MSKKFIKFSIIAVSSTAILAVLFSLLNYFLSEYVVEPSMLITFSGYLKRFFNLVSLFTGYGIIIYSFSRFKPLEACKSFLIFGISVGISYIYQTIASSIVAAAESATVGEAFGIEAFLMAVYMCLGQCIISQVLPALLVAFLTHILTKNGARKIERFISWKNPIQRAMIIMSLIIFGFYFLYLTFFVVLPFLIEAEVFLYGIYPSDLADILLEYFNYIVFYFVLQYIVYYFTYLLCYKFEQGSGKISKTNMKKIKDTNTDNLLEEI